MKFPLLSVLLSLSVGSAANAVIYNTPDKLEVKKIHVRGVQYVDLQITKRVTGKSCNTPSISGGIYNVTPIEGREGEATFLIDLGLLSLSSGCGNPRQYNELLTYQPNRKLPRLDSAGTCGSIWAQIWIPKGYELKVINGPDHASKGSAECDPNNPDSLRKSQSLVD